MIEIWDQPGELCIITSKKFTGYDDGDISNPDNWSDEHIIDTVLGWDEAITRAETLNDRYQEECFRVVSYDMPVGARALNYRGKEVL